MTATERRTFPARMAHLPEAIAFIETFCAERGLAASDALRLALVVEELFTNTVTHGYGGGSDALVRLEAQSGPTHIELTYEDGAPPFDLLAHHAASSVDPATDILLRPIGGLGIALVVRTAERIGYAREDGRNCVRLAVRRQAP